MPRRHLPGALWLITALLFYAACGGGGGGDGEHATLDSNASRVQLRWESGSVAAGYEVAWGNSPGVYTNALDVGDPSPGEPIATYVLDAFESGTYYFAIRAYDGDGRRSDYSNELALAIP